MTQSVNVRKFAGYAFLASVINSAIFLIAKSLDASMVVNQGGSREISLAMDFGATFFGLIVAAYLVSLIGKKSQSFLTRSPQIGLVFGVVTSVAPFLASDDSKTAVALATNHVVAGVIWYLGANRAIK